MYTNNKDAIDSEINFTFSNGVIEALGIHVKSKNLVVIIVYRQPDDPEGKHRSGSKEFKNLLNELSVAFSNLPSPTPDVLLCEDFNLPHAVWSNGTCSTGATRDEQCMVRDLYSLANEHFMTQVIDRPTHRSGNTLDLVFTNNANYVHSYSSNITALSDHFLVQCQVAYADSDIKNDTTTSDKEDDEELSFRDYNFFHEDFDWNFITDTLGKVDWRLCSHKSTPEKIMETFLSVCLEIVMEVIPLKWQSNGTKSRKAHGIPRHRRNLMRTRRKINIQLASCHSESRRNALNKRLIEIEKQLQTSHKAQSEAEEKKAVEKISSNSKYFYSYAKRFSNIKVGIGPLLVVSCPKRISEMLSEQYSSVFSRPKCDISDINNLFEDEVPNLNGISDIDFGEEVLIEAMGEFACNSAAGPDGPPAMMLNKCRTSLTYPLFLIWRKSVNEGIVPNSCKLGNIIPIHKGKSRAIAKNYRSVALTSLLVKTFEKVVCKQLVQYFDEHEMFNDSQHGFRSSWSCLSQFLAHFDHITRLLEEGKSVDVVYLDFAKAFDKVDIGKNLRKLKSLGIHGNLGKWLLSFLSGRLQCVLVNGKKSQPKPVLSGVPQGSVLGPLLFLILIGDIDKDIVTPFLSSFADDTRVGHAIASKEDMTQLQTDLETVYCWAVRNNMEFNSDKFEFIRYSPTKSPLDTGNTQYYSNIGTPIQQQRHIRDLGVSISEDATFSQYISEKIATMKSKTGWVLHTFQTRDRKPMLTLWKSLILSEHDYCCQLWNPHCTGEVQSLEVLQHFFIKKISGVSHLSYWDQLSKLKMYSLERPRERYIAIYIWKILEGTVPNVGSDNNAITATWLARRGRECNIPKISTTAPTRIQNIHRASFTVNGPRIFNSLPQYIRDTTKCDKNVFKAHLDHYLQQVPDQPLIPGYTAYRMCDSNSLIDWSRNAQLKTQLEEPPRENSLEAGEEAVYSDLSQ